MEKVPLDVSPVMVEADDNLDLVLQRLEAGAIKSWGDLKSDLETPAEKKLIKNFSLVRNFNEELFSETVKLLPVDEGSPSFAQFTRNPSVEEVPRTANTFRVKDDVRQQFLREWKSDFSGEDKAALTQTPFLRNLLARHASEDELDRLAILLITDPAAGEAKFLELFAEADRNFDLARCNDVLKILEDRETLLTDALKKLCRQKRQYLTNRSIFAADYYQTVFYYPRNSIVTAFEDLLREKTTSKWIFQLYARGGLGKTMFVRWLLARHCVPHETAVARIDFDFVHTQTVSRYPWLLLLSLAEQLNRQIEGSPFGRSFSTDFDLVSLLSRPGSEFGSGSRKAREEKLKQNEVQLRETVVKKFIDALNESSYQKTFVIVLDTLEQMALYRKPGLLAVLEQLQAVHKGYDRTRLLLSGRYNLEEYLKEYKNRFKKDTVTHELQPFDKDDARIYLTQHRGVKDESIVNAIVAKCASKSGDQASGNGAETSGNNPFKLSLFVDLYEQKEVNTATEILNYPSTDIEYLIHRVVRRIVEPTVQWLLRYAAIPRQFNYEIFEKVLAPHLVAELIEARQWDQVNRKFPPGAESFNEKEHWKPLRGNKRTLNLRAIWSHLRKYASSYSFISFDSGEDSAVRLQPDVVVPMRRLLKQQEIFRPLHADAEKYFLAKARHEKDSKQWVEHICEAIYHRFQRQGRKAAPFWRRLLERIPSRRDPAVRKAIVEEILGRDYVAEDLDPQAGKLEDQALVALDVQFEARCRAIEASVAAIVNLEEEARPTEWESVSDRLEQVKKLCAQHGRKIEIYKPPFNAAVIRRLALRMQETVTDPRTVIPLLREAIRTTRNGQMRISLIIQLAEALSSAESVVKYKQALKLNRLNKYSHINEADVHMKIARWHHGHRNFHAAFRAYQMALLMANKAQRPDTFQETLRYVAELNLELGLYETAFDQLAQAKFVASRFAQQAPPVLDAVLLSRIQARGFHQPLEALQGITPLLQTAKGLRERAEVVELYGEVLGKLMQFDQALGQLEDAKELWTQAADPIGTDRARMLRIELQLFEIGNFLEVDYLLNSWEDLGSTEDVELTCRLRLLRVFWMYRTGNVRGARRHWLKLMKDPSLRRSAPARVRALSTGLALGFGDRVTIRKFIRELGRIYPPAARLPFLTAFQYANPDSGSQLTTADRSAIKDLVSIKSSKRDIIPHALTCAEVLVWCGASGLAKKQLDVAARETLKMKNSLFAYRVILRAKDHLGLPHGEGDVLSKSNFLKAFSAFPNLCYAAILEQAERYLEQEKLDLCEASLTQASQIKRTSTTIHLEAHFRYLRGELAQAKGQPAEAVKHFTVARSHYEALGNYPMAEALRKFLPLVAQSVGDNADVCSVRMKPAAKSLLVEVYRNDQPEFSETIGTSLVKLINADVTDRSAIYELSKLLQGRPREFEGKLGDMLFKGYLKRHGKALPNASRPSDFKLDSLSPALSKVPWEFARFRKKPIGTWWRYFYRGAAQTASHRQGDKWLQLALRHLVAPDLFIDGVMGPKTQLALAALRRKFRIPGKVAGAELNARIQRLLVSGKNKRNTRALIVRPAKTERHLGEDVRWLYEEWSFKTDVVWAEGLSKLKAAIAGFQPDVIHLQSFFREVHGTGQVYLDFGDDNPNILGASSSVSSQPSPSFLNDALAFSDPLRLRPLVILDCFCPSGLTERLHQLIYRNAFAAELFQFGKTSAVIAIGLAEESDLSWKQAETLIGGLSNTEPFGAIVNSLKEGSPSSVAQQISTTGVALFTNEPSLTVLARN
jgi:hypothetical protein